MAFLAAGTTLRAQENREEKLGLPGDNLNLYAVMKLFQESKTLEEFERNLNDPNSTINNLDLNGDNLVDYIKVIDNVDGDVHNIVLQVAVSPKENQDVAVFSVQRFHNGQVQIQLTGDEQLYGKDYIIEPRMDNANQGETPNPGYAGNARTINEQNVTYVNTTPVQISTWPLIRFMFMPSYVVWHSSWYWGYYPSYWHPWRPFSWNYYYGYQYNWNHYYYGHYHQSNIHYYNRWNDFYYANRRSYSPDVHHRIDMGYYRDTYSHPEQRREGEATFAKVHPEQYKRASALSNGTNSNLTRRPANTMSNRPATNQTYDNNTGINRRSTTPMNNNKNISNPPSGNNNVVDRRLTNDKTVINHPPENSSVTTRKSVTTESNKSVNTPSGQNAGTNRSINHTKTTTVNSANRKIENKGRPETIKKDEKTKETDNKERNH
jgi:hypothetical protein